MLNRTRAALLLGLILFVTIDTPALAQEVDPEPAVQLSRLLPAALVFLLPLGLILIISSSMPTVKAPMTAVNLLVGWIIAALAYFAVGFAFNFGGIAQVSANPAFTGLYWEWYPLDQSVEVEVARFWGVVALQGWGLMGSASRPEVLLLFLNHIALVGAAATIPAGVLNQHNRGAAALLVSGLMGGLIYPVAGNWLWGGGWLSHTGASLGLGHGVVDFGGASVIFLAGSGVAMAGLLAFRLEAPMVEDDFLPEPSQAAAGSGLETPEQEKPAPFDTRPMPSAYLPILSILGGGLVMVGWFGLAAGLHTPTALHFSPIQIAVAGVMSGLAAALAAAGYSWFTSEAFDHFMTARGLAAGLIVSAAGAPFLPLWQVIIGGLLMGVCLPPLVYAFEHKLPVTDRLGLVATCGVSAVVSLLLVGLFADGQAGQGWNGIGLDEYNGVAGQGVSGLVVASGFAADWPGQFQAQLLGLGAVLGWSLLVGFAACRSFSLVARLWQRGGSEPEAMTPEAEATALLDGPALAEFAEETVEASPESVEKTWP